MTNSSCCTVRHQPPVVAPANPGKSFLNAIFLFLVLFTACAAAAQERMTQNRLHDLIVDTGTDVIISGNTVQFTINDVRLICISDSAADRMRILSPIIELSEIDGEQLLLALAANYHSVLDARYALSEGVIYAAYIHPLSSLSKNEFLSAVSQVATARITFGNEYSSGELIFPGSNP